MIPKKLLKVLKRRGIPAVPKSSETVEWNPYGQGSDFVMNRRQDLPDEVPVLTAADFTCGVRFEERGYRDDAYTGKCCAVGWGNVLFGESDSTSYKQWEEAYCEANKCVRVVSYNDGRCRTDAERARAFNRSLVKLEYDVPKGDC